MNAPDPLHRLRSLGQSVWIDFIRRRMIDSGELARLIREDGVTGVTTNPAIFHSAIVEHDDYDRAITQLTGEQTTAAAVYESLVADDVRRAADLLRGAYEASGGRDGYVSLEVSPHLAYQSDDTIAEAQRLWKSVGRPNLMIKVPATRSGLPAIRRLIAAGVNVNVTLLFSVSRYCDVAEAFQDGLEERARRGEPLDRVASVASFFLSRIDTFVDERLDALGSADASSLRGCAATASARLAYQEYKRLIAAPRWQALAARGAQPQRLLWASTSAKDPAYDDLKYVEALVGAETVNTLPPATLAAYRDRGSPALRLEQELEQAHALPERLAALGIDLAAAGRELERQGVQKFVDSYDGLLAALAGRATTGEPGSVLGGG